MQQMYEYSPEYRALQRHRATLNILNKCKISTSMINNKRHNRATYLSIFQSIVTCINQNIMCEYHIDTCDGVLSSDIVVFPSNTDSTCTHTKSDYLRMRRLCPVSCSNSSTSTLAGQNTPGLRKERDE